MSEVDTYQRHSVWRPWKRRLHRPLAVMVMTLAFALPLSPAAQAQDPIEVAPPPMGAPGEVRDCNDPPADPSQGWVCIPNLELAAPTTESGARSGTSSYCTPYGASGGQACWYVTSDFKANFYSNDIRYMLNATEVGRGEMEIQWTLEGNGTFVDLYTVKNSVPTSAIFFLVSLNNGGVLVNGGGSEINFAPLCKSIPGSSWRCTPVHLHKQSGDKGRPESRSQREG